MSRNQNDPPEPNFHGYTSPNYTQVPDELFDRQLPDLSGAELKVLLYIMRRTFGFKKDADNISLNQICRGITTRDGRALDRGTGLSKSTAQLAIRGLLEKNIILTEKRVSKEKGNEATTFRLNLGGPYTENRHRGAMPEIGTALYRKSALQETGIQETDGSLSKFERSHDRIEVTTGERREATPPPPVPNPVRTNTEEVPNPEPTRREVRLSSSGFTGVGELLARHQSQLPPASTPATTAADVDGAEERDMVGQFLVDFSREFNDQAKLSSSITRAINLFKRADMPFERWGDCLYQARVKTQEHTASIRKRAGEGTNSISGKNKAPYFFACLEQVVGLRPNPPMSRSEHGG